MSMSGAQTSAFQAAAGFPPSAGEGLFIGAAMTFLLLWSAWAMYSTWRGWATNNLDSATAGASAIRILVLLGIHLANTRREEAATTSKEKDQ